jgi:uncharacterized protein YaaN involved in tellurite resistance
MSATVSPSPEEPAECPDVPAEQPQPPSREPAAPPTASAADLRELEERARSLLGRLAGLSEDSRTSRSLGALGVEAQQRAARSMVRVESQLRGLLGSFEDVEARMPSGLVELQEIMLELDPHGLSTRPQGLLNRLLRRPPETTEVLTDLASRCDALQGRLDGVVDALRIGKDELVDRDRALGGLGCEAGTVQVEIQKAAYLGELLWRGLEPLETSAADPEERAHFGTVLRRVAVRVHDLRGEELAQTRLFARLEALTRGDEELAETILRALTAARSFLTLGLAVPDALAKEETDTDLALDELKQAFDELVDAVDRMDTARRDGAASSRDALEEREAKP